MKLSENGLNHLKEVEGVRYKAYKDSVGIWTIYVGLIQINGIPVKEGQTITEEEGDKELMKQLVNYEKCVNFVIKSNINQNQFDALVSICFNIGINAFTKSTLTRLVNNSPNDPNIAKAFNMWKIAGGKVSQGLLNRRKKEIDLYFRR